MSGQIFDMRCYKLLPYDERPGYEREPIFVIANSIKDALDIAAKRPPSYSIKGVVDMGLAYLDVHKLPETTA